MRCPGFEQLIEYLDGRLSAERAEPLAAHLATGCRRCEADRQWYKQVRTLAASDDTIDPPAWVTRRALQLFDSLESQPGIIERVGRLIAALVFDSLAQPAVAGVRSTETASRQLLYSAENYSIDLQISPSDKSNAIVMGQVLRKDDLRFESVSNIPLSLVRRGESVASVVTNETGEFVLTEIDCGEYDLFIDARDLSITVTSLPVTQSN